MRLLPAPDRASLLLLVCRTISVPSCVAVHDAVERRPPAHLSGGFALWMGGQLPERPVSRTPHSRFDELVS